MYFVKLTTVGGNPCYVNLEKVSEITEVGKETYIYFGGEERIIVYETFNEIRHKASLLEK